MGKAFAVFVVFAVIGAALMGYNNTLVKSPSGMTLVSKSPGSFNELFIDVSSWEVLDFMRHPRMKRAMINGQIPDFDNMRMKLTAADKVRQLGEAVDNVVKKAKSGIRELDEKYEIREKIEQTGRKVEDIRQRLMNKFQGNSGSRDSGSSSRSRSSGGSGTSARQAVNISDPINDPEAIRRCSSFMRVALGAIEMYVMDHSEKIQSGDVSENSAIGRKLVPNYVRKLPRCPFHRAPGQPGAAFYYNAANKTITCPLHGTFR